MVGRRRLVNVAGQGIEQLIGQRARQPQKDEVARRSVGKRLRRRVGQRGIRGERRVDQREGKRRHRVRNVARKCADCRTAGTDGGSLGNKQPRVGKRACSGRVRTDGHRAVRRQGADVRRTGARKLRAADVDPRRRQHENDQADKQNGFALFHGRSPFRNVVGVLKPSPLGGTLRGGSLRRRPLPGLCVPFGALADMR